MTDIVETIVSMAQLALPDDRVPTEEEIRDTVARLSAAFNVPAAVQTSIIQKVQARRLVKMDAGFALVEEHAPWLDARRPQIDPYYWSRFKQMLQKDFPPRVLSGLDRTTDEVLDLLGNPDEPNTWKRRGLVMGDVQSGKTATYSALICKAADAGYRFIILLTGTIENLRRQTQERLDAGFVGFDSSEQLKRNGRNLKVGVGLLDGRRQATVFTSSSTDFRVATLEALGLSLDALREPALVVVKKHRQILANLRDWLTSYNNATPSGGGIDIPMLMIDDEADNASINTNDPDKDPTAVNAGIRELLGLFRRTTYVGFTATPFANIFVNPDSKEDMLGDDLFPRDFIYTLQAPTNYFGPQKIFDDDAGARLHLRSINDAETALPIGHKSTHTVPFLPQTLRTALAAFLLANAIRDLRGERKTHRSMLVNVSQYTKVQNQVEELLQMELGLFQTAIRSFSKLPPATALTDGKIKELHDVWQAEYSDSGFDWPTIQAALHDAALPVTTKAVNQDTGPRALDYRAYRDTGLRVVAIGGNSLSRGLTLEGLTISYFKRTTQMYDTLLQMGRWFGYRPGYEDICRVWLPTNAIDWYGHISDATDELRAELKKMFRLRRTPKDFGLAVRAHPDSLLVTARNKMRTAKEVTRIISLSEASFESVELPASDRDLSENWKAAAAFLEQLVARLGRSDSESGLRLFRGATRAEVARLLRSFKVPATEFRFQPEAIAELLDRLAGSTLDDWDVHVPSGDGAPVNVAGLAVSTQVRSIRREDPPGVLTVSGTKRRVGSRGVEKAGLTEDQARLAAAAALRHAEEKAQEKGEPAPTGVNVADRFYRAQRSRPLLLIHLLSGTPEDERTRLPTVQDGALVALGLSFPPLPADSGAREVRYKINLVKARELFGTISEEEDDEDDGTEGGP